MDIAAYMMSCAQRESVRRETLAGFAGTDWAEDLTLILDESDSDDVRVRHSETYARLLAHFIADERAHALILEDDLRFNLYLRHNLYNWTPMWHRREHFYATLYNPGFRRRRNHPDVAYFPVKPAHFYGTQAVVISRPTAQDFLARWDELIQPTDLRMARYAARVCTICAHRPSLVQHLRVPSTMGENAGGEQAHYAVDFSPEWKATPRSVARSGSTLESHDEPHDEMEHSR